MYVELPDVDRNDRLRIYKLSIGFFLLAAAYYGAQNYITTILGPYGNYSLATFFGSQALMAFLAPTLIRTIRGNNEEAVLNGEKRGLVIGTLGYVPYLISLTIPNALILQLVAGAIQGIASGVLWVAQGSILTACSRKENREKMAGTFWGIYQAGQMIGNLGTSMWQTYVNDINAMFLACAVIVACSGMLHATLFNCRTEFEIQDLAEGLKVRASMNNPTGKSLNNSPPKIRANSHTRLIGHKSDAAEWPRMLCGYSFTNMELAASLARTRHSTTNISVLDGALSVVNLFRVPHMLAVAPLCWFIGTEVAYNSGTFPTLLDQKQIGTTLAFLGVGELIGSFTVGTTVEICGAGLSLVWASLVYLSGLTLSIWALRDGNWNYNVATVSVPGILCTMSFGYADAFFNSLALARLGGLATDWKICAGIVAYSFYLVLDVGSSAAAFFYLSFIPLKKSYFEAYLLCLLAVLSCIAFIAGTPQHSTEPYGSRLGLRRSISHHENADDD